MIRLLVVGKDDFTYNRTAVLLAGLQAHPQVKLTFHPLITKSRKEGNELNLKSQDYDFVLVPAFRHTDMGFVKRWSHVPVIFDPLISKFLTKVVDYKHYYKLMKYVIDYRAFHRADLLIADTECHRQYYNRVFKVPLSQIVTIPVGVNTDEYQPKPKKVKSLSFNVGFYGSFVPLQGTALILEAAKLLLPNKDIVFKIIGTGYHYKAAQKFVKKHQLNNVNLEGWVEQERLMESIADFDLCLGIFGSSTKANSVVPNKIYHYAAMGKPIITKDTRAIREVFDESSLELIPSEPSHLVQAILKLKDDEERRDTLGNSALQIIEDGYTHHHVAQRLVERLDPRNTK